MPLATPLAARRLSATSACTWAAATGWGSWGCWACRCGRAAVLLVHVSHASENEAAQVACCCRCRSLALTHSACCACSQPAAHDMHAVLLSLIIAMHSDHASSHLSICPCSVHRLDRGGGPRRGGRQPGGGGSHHSAGAGTLHPALLPPALRPRRLPPAQVGVVVAAEWRRCLLIWAMCTEWWLLSDAGACHSAAAAVPALGKCSMMQSVKHLDSKRQSSCVPCRTILYLPQGTAQPRPALPL